MMVKELFSVSIICSIIIATNAGWCYYGGCHKETGIFEKACPSMADSVGRDNMKILGHDKCDTWHESLWGKKYFCCTNDCGHQACGSTCKGLKMQAVEDTEWTRKIPCIYTNRAGEEREGANNFCCK